MKKILFILLFFIPILAQAQTPTFANLNNLDKKPKRPILFDYGAIGHSSILEFTVSPGLYGSFYLIKTPYYYLNVRGEAYLSLMFAGYALGGGAKIGVHNYFRITKNYGLILGVGRNIRRMSFNTYQWRRQVETWYSHYQIDVGVVQFLKVRKKEYHPAGGVYLSYTRNADNTWIFQRALEATVFIAFW